MRTVAEPGVLRTQTVKRIAEVLDYCADQCAIGVMTADFGGGKTEAVKAWRRGTRERSRAWCSSSMSSPAPTRSTSCVFWRGSSAWRMKWIAERRHRVPGHLRVPARESVPADFRPVRTVRPRVCQIIRQIWDRTNDAGVGVVMLAAPILLARLMAGKMVDLGALDLPGRHLGATERADRRRWRRS